MHTPTSKSERAQPGAGELQPVRSTVVARRQAQRVRDSLGLILIQIVAGGAIASSFALSLVYDGRQVRYTYYALGAALICWAFDNRRRARNAPVGLPVVTVIALSLPLLRFVIEGIPSDGRYQAVMGSIIGYPAFWWLGTRLSYEGSRVGEKLRLLLLWTTIIGTLLSAFAFLRGVSPRSADWLASRGLNTNLANGWHTFAVTGDNVWIFAFVFALAVSLLGEAAVEKRTRIGLYGLAICAVLLLIVHAEFALSGGAALAWVLARISSRGTGRRSSRGRFWTIVAIAGIVAMIAFLWTRDLPMLDALKLSLYNKSAGAGRTPISTRADVWRSAIDHVMAAPFLGYGISYWGPAGDDFSYGNPHNIILSLALRIGIPGMIVVVMYVVWIGLRCVILGRSTHDLRTRRCAQIAVCSWGALWIPCVVSGRIESAYFCGFGLCAVTSIFLQLGESRRAASLSPSLAIGTAADRSHLTAA